MTSVFKISICLHCLGNSGCFSENCMKRVNIYTAGPNFTVSESNNKVLRTLTCSRSTINLKKRTNLQNKELYNAKSRSFTVSLTLWTNKYQYLRIENGLKHGE